MPKILTRFSTYTLLVALSISVVAEFYSIVGLTTIFSAAVIPVVIMGVVLGLGKIMATVWLKLNWDRSPLTYKLYLIPAIIVLMFLTSMGIFGFLSKAHGDQSLISGDSQAKIAIFDEKIKTSKENIDANRKALKQLDEAVDQVMGRSTSEAGADKAVQVRRAQANDRKRLLAEISQEQKTISQLSEESAPLRAENRKIEAEVGPLKYIAAMIYGDDTDKNMIESAVRWVIIIIVAVFDPLALMLLLAAQQSFRWERQRDQEEEQQKQEKDRLEEEQKEKDVDEFFEKSYLLARELDRDLEQRNIDEANALLAEVEKKVPEVIIPEEPKYEKDDGPLTDDQVLQLKEEVALFKKEESDPSIDCYKCGTELINAPGIGPFCPNKACDVMDGPFNDREEPVVITYIPPAPLTRPLIDDVPVSSSEVTVDSDAVVLSPVATIEPEIATEDVTTEKVLYNYSDSHIIFEGKKMSIDNLKSIRPDLILPQDGKIPNKIEFGSEFPKFSLNGDTYIRVDSIPHRVYKFNGRKWMAVDKAVNTTYLTNINYLRYLIQKLELNEYDPEFLTLSEQDEIENYLTSKKG